MAVKPIQEQAKIFYDKAKEAFSRNNYNYTLTLLFSALNLCPDYPQARNLFHSTALKRYEETFSFFTKVILFLPNILYYLRALLFMRKKEWLKAVYVLENIVKNAPKSSRVVFSLAVCFEKLKMYESQKDTFEFLRKINPGDLRALKNLGAMYKKEKNLDKAKLYYEEVLRFSRNDNEAEQGIKDISAMKAIEKGGWENTETYRDKIKNQPSSDLYETEARSVKSLEDVQKLIAEKESQIEKNPKNIALLKEIAGLFVRKNDFNKAKFYYSQALILNPSDISLEEELNNICVLEKDMKISHLTENIKKEPDNNALKKEIERLGKERDVFVLESAEKMVLKYPSSLQIRYNLGVLYYNKGSFKEAVQEFQHALKEPARRILALNYMGLCFMQEGKYDIAIKQFEKALENMKEMDSFAKEITYNLGCVFEKTGEQNKAIAEFKKIYQADIGYKDVSEKIDKAYGKNG